MVVVGEALSDGVINERTMSDAAVGVCEDSNNELSDDVIDKPTQDHANYVTHHSCQVTEPNVVEEVQERRPRVIPSAMKGFIKNHADKIYELAHEDRVK